MNTCDTCRYWSGAGPTKLKWCSNPKLMVGGKIPPENDAIYGAAEGLSYIITGPKFGCVHHDPLNPDECPGCWDSKCIHTCGK